MIHSERKNTNVAVQSNVPVIVFNLEMSKEQVANRIICSEAMVDSNKIRTGKIEDEDWIKLANASGKLAEAPIYIDDTPGISIMEIRAKCRKMKLEKKMKSSCSHLGETRLIIIILFFGKRGKAKP